MEQGFELSREESKIINLMTEGYTYKQIADKMGKSLDSVSVDITRVKRRYGCRTVVQLVALILRSML
jgi:DNA-binding CsgD family transcriptional regulator